MLQAFIGWEGRWLWCFAFGSEVRGGNPFLAAPKKPPRRSLHRPPIPTAASNACRNPVSILAPCMALGLRRRRAVLGETPPSSREESRADRRSPFAAAQRMRCEFPRSPYWTRIRFLPAESTNKNAPRGGVFICWWSRRESNPRPQALYRPLYILRSRYLILTSHTPTGRLVRSEPP